MASDAMAEFYVRKRCEYFCFNLNMQREILFTQVSSEKALYIIYVSFMTQRVCGEAICK